MLFLNLPESFACVATPEMLRRQARTQRHEKGLTFIRVRTWLARATGVGQTVCDPYRQAGTRKWVDICKSASVACARALHVHDRLFVTQAGRDTKKV